MIVVIGGQHVFFHEAVRRIDREAVGRLHGLEARLEFGQDVADIAVPPSRAKEIEPASGG